MNVTSNSHLVLGYAGPPGLGEFFLMLIVSSVVVIVLPPVFCFLGERGRTPVIWRPFIYVLAVLIGTPSGAAGGYATFYGMGHLLRLGQGGSYLEMAMITLPGMLISGGLLSFAIARLLTKHYGSSRPGQ